MLCATRLKKGRMSKVYLTAVEIEAIERRARRARATELQRILGRGFSLVRAFFHRLRAPVQPLPR
jgi:hypothetical protein